MSGALASAPWNGDPLALLALDEPDLNGLLDSCLAACGPDSASLDEGALQALRQSFELMAHVDEQAEADGADDDDSELKPEELSQIGSYGLQLVEHWLAAEGQARRVEAVACLEQLMLAMCLWQLRHQAPIVELEVVVNCLASLANQVRAPEALARLSSFMGAISHGVAIEHSADLDRSNPMRPWRVLQLNRAIVATRSHDVSIMEAAFEDLVQALPEDARAFFKEGMEQMDIVGYPEHVRVVMTRFYQLWGADETLH